MIAWLGPHWGFIVTAYAVFFVVVIGLIAWVMADAGAQRRALADLEARGAGRRHRRRSDSSLRAPTVTAGVETSGATAEETTP